MTDRVLIAAAWLLVAVIIAIVLAVRVWIAGGDIGCAFSADPALCAAVKGPSR
ncbi:hypothetical protein QE418_003436 [Microbacterium testaceum]|uniref:hypothetical protein n=1 Tax=Microbacterium TaxID=33882 RepID=UPI002788DBB5|nr:MULTISPECIES: hypothetical protein [Microbacterium]MDQ1113988.1 hypothetical protein [Microbacterium testaceum]MDR6098905.1 hypothetical protein [Microbacterium sp. SORGH_AS_0454]